MGRPLSITADAFERLCETARQARPAEACGLLGGSRGESGDSVTSVTRVENVADRPRARYELDSAELLVGLEALATAGHEHVGFYHSHPRGPAGPSDIDRDRATWPGYSYCILDLAGTDPVLGSWRWTGTTFERQRVDIGTGDAADH